jgi:hypothetical protein
MNADVLVSLAVRVIHIQDARSPSRIG